MIGVSGRTVQRMGKDGRLPKPIRLTSKKPVWFVESLKEHLSQLHNDAQGLGVEP